MKGSATSSPRVRRGARPAHDGRRQVRAMSPRSAVRVEFLRGRRRRSGRVVRRRDAARPVGGVVDGPHAPQVAGAVALGFPDEPPFSVLMELEGRDDPAVDGRRATAELALLARLDDRVAGPRASTPSHDSSMSAPRSSNRRRWLWRGVPSGSSNASQSEKSRPSGVRRWIRWRTTRPLTGSRHRMMSTMTPSSRVTRSNSFTYSAVLAKIIGGGSRRRGSSAPGGTAGSPFDGAAPLDCGGSRSGGSSRSSVISPR